jgi:hypothetical protein
LFYRMRVYQAAYERIEAAVRADPSTRHAQDRRAQLPPLMSATEEVFMTSTIDPGGRAESGG